MGARAINKLAVAAVLGAGALVAALPAWAGPAAGATHHVGSGTTIVVEHNKTWGTILALSNGDTVYRLSSDAHNKSVCTGQCAVFWPPVLLTKGQKRPNGRGVSRLGTIRRANGTEQVTYRGVPLYRFSGDPTAGAVNGNLKDSWGHWWVVNPAHPYAIPKRSGSTSSAPATSSNSNSYNY